MKPKFWLVALFFLNNPVNAQNKAIDFYGKIENKKFKNQPVRVTPKNGSVVINNVRIFNTKKTKSALLTVSCDKPYATLRVYVRNAFVVNQGVVQSVNGLVKVNCPFIRGSYSVQVQGLKVVNLGLVKAY